MDEIKCIQGALNAQAIRELKEQTKTLFSLAECQQHTLNSIHNTVIEIKTIQASEIEHRKSADIKISQAVDDFSDHIKTSPERLDALKKTVSEEIDQKVKDTKSHVNFWVGVPSFVVAIISGLIYFIKETK